MSDLRLPYTKEELLNLLGNIKNEEELREFIQQNSASAGGGHTDEEIRIIVSEWYQANKDTQLTKEDVDGWIAEYLAENPVSGGGTSIDDSVTSVDKTWSSQKISDKLSDIALEGIDETNVITNKWKEKKCAFLGDSITEGVGTTFGKRYFEYLSKLIGIKCYGYGVNGASYKDLYKQAQYVYSAFGTEIDAIFVFAGTNDFIGASEIGDFFTEEDGVRSIITDDTTTFKGSINYLLNYLKHTFQDAQIVLMTPIHRAYAKFSSSNIQENELHQNSNGIYFEKYIEAIREASDVWSLPLIDLYSDSGLFPLYDEYAKYFNNASTDRLHPNALGHQRIAHTICQYLSSISPTVKNEQLTLTDLSSDSAEIKVGDVSRVQVLFEPQNSMYYDLNYSSDNEDVVLVDSNGSIFGVNTGTANVKVTDSISGLSTTCSVTVSERTNSDLYVLTSNLTHFDKGNNYEFQNDQNVPWGIAVDFDSTNKTTICSGKTIKRIVILVTNDGLLTIGKGSLEHYGSSYFEFTEKIKCNVVAGFNVIDVNFVCGENETILIGDVSDNSTPYYSWSGGGLTDEEMNSFLVLSNKKMRQGSNPSTALHGALYCKEQVSSVTRYTVTNNLTKVTNSNTISSVLENSSYTADITANTGYVLGEVTVTMDGVDITSTSYSNGKVTISNVTGNVVITASATAEVYNVTKSETNCSITGADTVEYGSSYSATITANNGYTLNEQIVTMGGNTLSGVYSNGTITIENVTGEITITATAIEESSVVNATSITLSPTAVSFDTAGDTSTVIATLEPSNTTDTVASWVSDNESVATVENGVITSVANGTATITATTSNGLTATVEVSVNIATEPLGSTVFYGSKMGNIYTYTDPQKVDHANTMNIDLSSDQPYLLVTNGYGTFDEVAGSYVAVVFSDKQLKTYASKFKCLDGTLTYEGEVYYAPMNKTETTANLQFTKLSDTTLELPQGPIYANYDVYNYDASSIVLEANYNQSDYE